MIGRRFVLVVDDDTPIRTTIAEILGDEGYAVREAANGAAALAVLRTESDTPGLILLDLRMPVMDGFDFRARQLEDPALASIPVVVLSADSDVFAKAATLKTKAVLRKPIDLQALIDFGGKVLLVAPKPRPATS